MKEDRALPRDAYLRTLPAGPGPRLAGRLLNGLAFSGLGLLPLVVLAAVLTEASLPLVRVLPTAGALGLAALPSPALALRSVTGRSWSVVPLSRVQGTTTP